MASKSHPLSLIQFTDPHILASPEGTLCGLNTRESFSKILAELKRFRPRPKFFLATGDISQDGSFASYRQFKTMVLKLGRPVYCLAGNHDRGSSMGRILKGLAVRVPNEIRTPHWDFILLNSTRPPHPTGWLRPSELRRLKNFLKTHRNRSIMIVLHHPPIPLGSVWLDEMKVQNNAQFLRLCRSNPNVKVVLFGHAHQSFTKKIGPQFFLATPSTCIQFRPKRKTMGLDHQPPGFRWFQLWPNGKFETGVRRLKGTYPEPDYSIKRY